MQFRRVRTFRGPNIWARVPVLEALVELREQDRSTDLVVRLRGSLPWHIRQATDPGDPLAQLSRELQARAGTPVEFARSEETSEPGVCHVVVAYEYEPLGRACLETARRICLAALESQPIDVQDEVRRLRALEYQLRPGPGTRAIVRAARARGLPVEHLGQPPGNLIQLGYGAKQRRVSNARTDRTDFIAQAISQDKELTRQLLREAGIPVPEGRPVADAEDAWEAARQIGLPVVVKPCDQDNGRGVALNLATRDQVRAAYLAAQRESPNVLVERQASGWHHRLLVIGGRLVAAARRDPAQVVGDGAHTIGQLVARANADPRRGPEGPLCEICIDETAREVLAGQGYTLESVPPAGARVLIHQHSYLQDGGTLADVTDRVHPDVASRVIEATRVIGLDLAGIDVVAKDLARPLEEQDGVVLEVNDTPALGQHVQPLCDPPRPVGEAIVDQLFAPGQTGRIPVVAVTGAGDRTSTTRLIAHVLGEAGRRIGTACADGLFLAGRRVRMQDCSGLHGARAVLRNPTVEVAVLETNPDSILREGLGFDRCDVAVVMDGGADDTAEPREIETPQVLARLTEVLVEVVVPEGAAVLQADARLAALSGRCSGSVVFFSRVPDHPVLAAHRKAGGRVVFAQHGEIRLAEGPREDVLCRLVDVPLTHGDHASLRVESVLAAAATAWALGKLPDTIRAGLLSFPDDAGGRAERL